MVTKRPSPKRGPFVCAGTGLVLGLVCQLCGLWVGGYGKRLIETEDEPCAGGKLLLDVALEPPDGAKAGAYSSSNDSADATSKGCASDRAATGGSAYGDECCFGMTIADDGAFGVDVRTGKFTDAGDLSVERMCRAVGEGDGFRAETDGGAPADSSAAVDFGDAAANLRADGKEDFAVLRNGRCE